MRAVVLQSSYLPWRGTFDLIHDADVFVYYDEVAYSKNGWRNRNRLYPKSGLHWLTVPVPKAASGRPISEVALTDDRWQKKHLRALSYGYASAPCFGELEDLLDETYRQRSWERLVDLNRFLIERIAAGLDCRARFLDSASFPLAEGRVARLLGLLQQLGASEYLTGPAGWAYLEEAEGLFADAGIAIRIKDYSDYPPYPQLREPFEPAVSILDLIANVGFARAPWYIWGHRDEPEPS